MVLQFKSVYGFIFYFLMYLANSLFFSLSTNTVYIEYLYCESQYKY